MKYECHITIDPVDKWSRINQLEMHCDQYHFKLAKLIKVTGELNERDQFMTGHGVNYDELKLRMSDLCDLLKEQGYVIRRYKIEKILLDSRIDDSEGLL
jgi:hypothetical protein